MPAQTDSAMSAGGLAPSENEAGRSTVLGDKGKEANDVVERSAETVEDEASEDVVPRELYEATCRRAEAMEAALRGVESIVNGERLRRAAS